MANVAITTDLSTSHVEPYIAINPADPANLIVTARVRTPGDTASLGRIGTDTSNDGGATWRDDGILPQPPGYQFTADSTIAFTPAGTALVAAEGPQGSPGGADNPNGNAGVFVWRSTDHGRTFSQPLMLSPPSRPADHTWLAVGQPGTRYARDTYVVWNSGSLVEMALSADDGKTFSPARPIAQVGSKRAFATVVSTGPGGRVDVTYAVTPPSSDAPRYLIRSTDGGRTFSPPIPITSAPARVSISGVPGQSNLQSLTTDPKTGAAYIALDVPARSGTAIGVWKITGQKPSLLTAIKPPAAGASLTQPQLAAPGDGRLLLSYFTSQPDGTRETIALVDATAGTTMSLPISTAAFNPVTSTISLPGTPPIAFIGDFQGLAVAASTVHLVWNDSRSGKQAQLYTARFPLGTPGQ